MSKNNANQERDDFRGWAKVLKPIAGLGAGTLNQSRKLFAFWGGLFLLFSETLSVTGEALLVPSAGSGRRALIFQMVRVGVKAIPIVILIEMAIGMILPLQMFAKLDEYGQAEQIATITAIAAFRELGPLMTAIVLSGFAGASIAAELGTMVTAEEVEALKSMALNPVRFLVVPRLIATVIMMVMLTIIADLAMVFSGWLTGLKLGIDADVYEKLTWEAVNLTGFATGLVKAGAYGMLIGLIACYLGLSVKPWQGSEGVGQATTNTVVYCIVAVIGAAAVFTMIFYAYGLFQQ